MPVNLVARPPQYPRPIVVAHREENSRFRPSSKTRENHDALQIPAQNPRDEFRQLTAGLPILQAEYCGVFGPEICADRVRRVVAADTEWLLTTRLDNDDALNPRFIETLQSEVRPGVREFINPTHGLIVANGKLYRHHDYSGPFISLSEPLEGCRTVWIDEHGLLSRHGSVRQFALRDAWIQVVHGGNLANQVRGVRISPTKVFPDVLPPALSASLVRVRLSGLIFANVSRLLRQYTIRAWRRGRRMLAGRRIAAPQPFRHTGPH
jgi:hypothetical protein